MTKPWYYSVQLCESDKSLLERLVVTTDTSLGYSNKRIEEFLETLQEVRDMDMLPEA